jgi:tetratricopeptide (TPR) repeat protein
MIRQFAKTAVIVFFGAAALLYGQQPPAAKQPQPKSAAEVEALKAMFSAPDPDSRIKAAENLMTKFADTDFKGLALSLEADAYRQKGDYEKMMIFGERALEADPKNYNVMIMLATSLAQRTREFDLDREEKLAKAEKYANRALAILKDAQKPNPGITDDQWEKAKKDFSAQAHEALGLAAMVRKKYDVAISEFKTSVDIAATQEPRTLVFLGNAYTLAGKPDDAIAVLDKVLTASDVNVQVKQAAQAAKVTATQMKEGKVKPPSTESGPKQVEIKQ